MFDDTFRETIRDWTEIRHPEELFATAEAWLAAHDAELLAAARRVAPDRETREKLREVVAGDVLGGWNEHHCIENQGCTACAGNRAVDALLASGVPGVPADQRTADRETIAQAIDRFTFAPSVLKLILARSGGTTTEGARRMAGAVLAVLVPADHVRAETLETAADVWVKRWAGEPVSEWLRARAAEYRKAASA